LSKLNKESSIISRYSDIITANNNQRHNGIRLVYYGNIRRHKMTCKILFAQ